LIPVFFGKRLDHGFDKFIATAGIDHQILVIGRLDVGGKEGAGNNKESKKVFRNHLNAMV